MSDASIGRYAELVERAELFRWVRRPGLIRGGRRNRGGRLYPAAHYGLLCRSAVTDDRLVRLLAYALALVRRVIVWKRRLQRRGTCDAPSGARPHDSGVRSAHNNHDPPAPRRGPSQLADDDGFGSQHNELSDDELDRRARMYHATGVINPDPNVPCSSVRDTNEIIRRALQLAEELDLDLRHEIWLANGVVNPDPDVPCTGREAQEIIRRLFAPVEWTSPRIIPRPR